MGVSLLSSTTTVHPPVGRVGRDQADGASITVPVQEEDRVGAGGLPDVVQLNGSEERRLKRPPAEVGALGGLHLDIPRSSPGLATNPP